MLKRKLTEYLSLLPLIDDGELEPMVDKETIEHIRYKYYEETPKYIIRHRRRRKKR